MSLSQLKKRVCEAIDERSQELSSFADDIQRNPELGFKEFRTSSKVKKKFEELDLEIKDDLAITGIRGKVGTGQINVSIVGELDAVVCPLHPMAVGTVAHACGHFAQITEVIGAGFGLVDSGVIDELNGSVTLFGAPAEEGSDYEYRRKLVDEGKLEFMAGKQELIRLGGFDDIDIAMMCHAEGNTTERKIWPRLSTNASIIKSIRYLGKAAHYTGAPWDGINALNAALLGLQAVNALRETFRDEDYIRFTPIITKGGESENIVPSQVEVSSYVKARTLEALTETDSRINKALVSGAQAIGAKVKISQFCNFMPLSPSIRLAEIFSNNASQFAQVMEEPVHRAWSTDMGDVSMIMPVLHPMIGGFTGGVHTKDFELKDKEMAYIIPAKIMAMTVADLLYDKLD